MNTPLILIVEDSYTMRQIMIKSVRKAGFNNIHEASDGREALAKLTTGNFDLLITDWNMPYLSGIDLARIVRADKRLKNLPIIMITGRNMKEDIVMAVRSGVNGYFTKPYNDKMVEEKLCEVLGCEHAVAEKT